MTTNKFSSWNFSDKSLNESWKNPISRDEYSKFGTTESVIGPGDEFVKNNYSIYDPKASGKYYDEEHRWYTDRQNKDNLTYNGALVPSGKIIGANEEMVDPDYGKIFGGDARAQRAYNALINPNKSNYYDVINHPDFATLRNHWYEAFPGMGVDKGDNWSGRQKSLWDVENQYKIKADQNNPYLPMDFYAFEANKNSPKQNTVGPIQRANLIGKSWASQPAFSGQFNWNDVAEWASDSAAKAEQQNMVRLAKKDAKDSAGFGGGLNNLVGLGLSLAGAPMGISAIWGAGGLLGGLGGKDAIRGYTQNPMQSPLMSNTGQLSSGQQQPLQNTAGAYGGNNLVSRIMAARGNNQQQTQSRYPQIIQQLMLKLGRR